MTYEEITVNADSGPSFRLGRMKRRNMIALHFELRPRWRTSHAGCFLAIQLLWLWAALPFYNCRYLDQATNTWKKWR